MLPLRLSLLAMACAAAVAACDSPRERLDADALGAAERHVASLDAEAALFEREAAAGHVSRSFVLVHRKALADESLQVDHELALPAPEALRARRDAAVLANARVRERVLALGHGGDA